MKNKDKITIYRDLMNQTLISRNLSIASEIYKRNLSIAELRAQGKTCREIAKKERQITTIDANIVKYKI